MRQQDSSQAAANWGQSWKPRDDDRQSLAFRNICRYYCNVQKKKFATVEYGTAHNTTIQHFTVQKSKGQ